MDKLTKVGLSALCGSLAAVASANAGEMTVKGGATATYSSNTGDVTGNPIGINSGLTFTGSGELDNGTTFTLTLTDADQAAYSAGSIAITFPSIGSVNIAGASGGNGIGGYDDKMPTAWEETWGTSIGTGIDLAKGVGSSMNIQYKTPSFAGGTTIAVAVAPGSNNGVKNNDKGVSGASGVLGAGVDVMVDSSILGQNIFFGYSRSERDPATKAAGTNGDAESDHEEGVAGAIFSIGPVQFGAQATAEWLGNEQAAANVAGYRNVSYGISFNVNDNLSLSYGQVESKKGFQSNDGGTTRYMKVESIQAAYTMGGVSLKAARTEVDNAVYASASASDKEGTTIALTLAF